MKCYALDANALIILLEGLNGTDRVQRLFDAAADGQAELLISAISVGEVFYSLWKIHGERAARESMQFIQAAPIRIIEGNLPNAINAAELKAKYHSGYADSFVAALAIQKSATVVTADRDFRRFGNKLKVLWLPNHKFVN